MHKYSEYRDYYKKKRDQAAEKAWLEVRRKHPEPDWKPVPGYPNYLVSKNGDVINKFGKKLRPGILKANGYMHVMLSDENKKRRHVYIYHAVWEAFIGARTPGKQICHLDSDPSNNSLDNLAEMTQSENLQKESTKNKRRGRKSMGRCCFTTYKYDTNGNLLKVYKKVKDVAEDGHSVSAVSQCCSGKLKTHQGFIFTHKKIRRHAN